MPLLLNKAQCRAKLPSLIQRLVLWISSRKQDHRWLPIALLPASWSGSLVHDMSDGLACRWRRSVASSCSSRPRTPPTHWRRLTAPGQGCASR